MMKKWFAVSAILMFTVSNIWSQACMTQQPAAGDFTRSTVVDIANEAEFSGGRYVMEMSFTNDGRVFFVVKEGHIGLVDNSGDVHLVHKLTVWDQRARMGGVEGQGYETGLRGIALDPNFETNNWIYVIYDEDKTQSEYLALEQLNTKVVRLTFNPSSNTIVPNSEKVILTWISNGIDHAAGSLAFGPDGVLHILTGDDTDSQSFNQFAPLNWADDVNPSNPCRKFQQAGSRVGGSQIPSFSPCASDASRSTANTNDLRGKTLRIIPIGFDNSETPTPGVGTTYTIPEGNLFPVGTEKARPEIYTMGHRASWRLNVDALTKWVFIGEGGPASTNKMDNGYTRGPFGHEELNIAHKASFFGWPYFNGNNEPYRPWDFSTNMPLDGRPHFDPDAPVVNESPRNTGRDTLPLTKPPAIWQSRTTAGSFSHSYMNRGGCVISSGPRYYYQLHEGSTGTATKFSPYYHEKLFFSDVNGGYIGVAEISYDALTDAVTLTNVEGLPGQPFGGWLLDFEMGPDGALYGAVNGRILKTAYTGSCRPADSIVVSAAFKGGRPSGSVQLIYGAGSQLFFPEGKQEATLFNLKGEQVWSTRKESENMRVPSDLTNNLYYIRFN